MNSIRIWPEKPLFLRGGLGSSSIIETETRCGLEILYQRSKRVKTKSQKVLGAKSYVSRSYREKTGSGGLFANSEIITSLTNKNTLKNERLVYVCLGEMIRKTY